MAAVEPEAFWVKAARGAGMSRHWGFRHFRGRGDTMEKACLF
jgi:hypothetical protein